MKKYKDYMDRVELSSEAHDRILQAMKRQEAAGAETPAAEKESILRFVTMLRMGRKQLIASIRTSLSSVTALSRILMR